jgi:hypothetical protein
MGTPLTDVASQERTFLDALEKRLEGRNSVELEVIDGVDEEFSRIYDSTYPVATLRRRLAEMQQSLESTRERRRLLQRERHRGMVEEIESLEAQLAAEMEKQHQLELKRSQLLERWSAAALVRVLQNARHAEAPSVEEARQAVMQCRRGCTFDEIWDVMENFLHRRIRQRLMEDMIASLQSLMETERNSSAAPTQTVSK